ncbi:hypothetical protein SMU68_08979, partial [Streptococcus mutans NFSM1]
KVRFFLSNFLGSVQKQGSEKIHFEKTADHGVHSKKF